MQVQDSLVNAHLEAIVGVGTLTARRLSGHDSQDLGGHAHRAGHLEASQHSLVLQVGAHLLEGADVAGGQGDADTMDGGLCDIDGFGLDRRG